MANKPFFWRALRPGDGAHDIAVPGVVNLHRRGFQPAMAGLAAVKNAAPDSFRTRGDKLVSDGLHVLGAFR